MSEFKIPYFNEQILVCRALIVAAKNVSSAMDKFVQWLLAGFAAGLTYILANQRVSFASLRPAILAYLCAVAFGVIQRYLAMVVSIGTQVFQEAEKLHDEKRPVDIARFFILYIDSLPAFNRWAAALSAKRFMKGDVIASGKGLLMFSIWQSILGLATIAMLAVAFYRALKVL
jgi:hypothetical protein